MLAPLYKEGVSWWNRSITKKKLTSWRFPKHKKQLFSRPTAGL